MSLIVADLAAKLGLDDSEFNRGMDGVAGKATRSEKILGGVSKAAMAGAVAAGALVVKSLDTYNNFGTAINTLTRLTGMSSEAASKLTGQWQRFGVDSQSGINATKFLAKNLDIAQQAALKTQAEIDGLDKGSKTYGESLSKLQVKLIGNEGAFARLGVSIFDAHGKLRSVDTILPQVRDKLSQMDDAGQRTALTLKLFGRGGADMLGWLTKTPKEIAAVNKELAGLGMVWGGKQVKDWKALKDAQREMGLQWTALQLNLAQNLLPVMKTLMGYVQTGIKDWNNLSDGTQGFILKATAAAGVLGIIGPKAFGFAKAIWEIAAAVRGVGTAQAVAGAAGAAGSAGGGLAAGVGANVASAAGIGGASRANAALTASSLGGVGVSPAAAIFARLPALVPTVAIAAALAGALVLGVDAGLKQAKANKTAQKGFWDDFFSTSGAIATSGADFMDKLTGNDKPFGQSGPAPAGTYKPIIQKLSMQMDTASYGEFQKLYGSIKSLQLLAGKGIVLNTKNLGKQTTGDLLKMRDTMMSSLHITARQAETVLNTIAGKKLDFNWHKQVGKEYDKVKDTVQTEGGAIAKATIAAGDKAGKGLAAGLNRGQGPTKAAAARLKAGATGPVAPIPGVLTSAGQKGGRGLASGLQSGTGPTRAAAAALAAASKPNLPDLYSAGVNLGARLAAGMNAGVGPILQAVNALENAAQVNLPPIPQIRPGRHALGGVFTRPTLGIFGEAGPEAIIPLSNPRRAAQVMDEAGLTGRGGGGTSLTFGSVNISLGTYDTGEDAGSAAADAFMQRTREIARGY